MDVVLRSLMAAGMGVYGTLHVVEAVDASGGAGPAWIVVVFGLVGLAAYGLLLGLVLAPTRSVGLLEHVAAGLALMSAVALTLVLLTGMLGLQQELQVTSAFAYVAEAVVLGSWLGLRIAPASTMEADEGTAREVVEG